MDSDKPRVPSPELLARATALTFALNEEVQLAHADAPNPVYVYDPFARYALRWGNPAAIAMWRCKTMEELRARDFDGDTDVAIRLLDTQLDEMMQEGGWSMRWTIYPDDIPKVCVNNVRAIRLPEDHIGYFIEVVTVDTGTTSESTRMHMATHYLEAAVTLFDMHGVLLMQNHAAGFAYPRVEGKPRSWMSRFLEAKDYEGAMAAVLAGRTYRGELRMATRDGARWQAVSAIRTKDPVTGEDAVVVQETNIERLRRAESELRDKNLQLEASLKDLHDTQVQLLISEKVATMGRLVAGLVHELNSPLGAISGSAQTAERALGKLRGVMGSSDGGPATKLLGVAEASHRVIGDGVARVSALVETLKGFSQLDQANCQPANLNDALEQTLTLARHELPDGVRIETAYGELPAVNCHVRELNQVFLNLIHNGLASIGRRRQGGAGGGSLRVSTSAEGSMVQVRVADDGVGIAEADLARIFEPNFTTRKERVSAGMGLSMCYRIVHGHGGKILAESRGPDRGATFTVCLPVEWQATGDKGG